MPVSSAHPFHPFRGQRLALLHRGVSAACEWVLLQLPDGPVLRIPIEWTDLSAPDPQHGISSAFGPNSGPPWRSTSSAYSSSDGDCSGPRRPTSLPHRWRRGRPRTPPRRRLPRGASRRPRPSRSDPGPVRKASPWGGPSMRSTASPVQRRGTVMNVSRCAAAGAVAAAALAPAAAAATAATTTATTAVGRLPGRAPTRSGTRRGMRPSHGRDESFRVPRLSPADGPPNSSQHCKSRMLGPPYRTTRPLTGAGAHH
jgi:hypothetical protein